MDGGGFHRSDAGTEVHVQLSAHSEIILADETQRIRNRSGAPGKGKLGGLKARGGTGNQAAQAEDADILQLDARAHGASLKVKLPAARAGLLDAAGDFDKRKWNFVVAQLEINSSAINVNLRRARRPRVARRGLRTHKARVRSGR